VLREGDTSAVLNATIADAMLNGSLGVRRDPTLYTHDWHIPVAGLEKPRDIGHGETDGAVTMAHAICLPGCFQTGASQPA
jgi:hypothetical protein